MASGLVVASVVMLGPASADAAIHYTLSYEGPRDASAVGPLLLADLVREDDGAGYGYGYGYGYGPGGVTPPAGYGYGYGYGYDDDGGLRFDDLDAGDYRVLGFADFDDDANATDEEPQNYGVDAHGATLFHLAPGQRITVSIAVQESGSNVTGRVVSNEGAPLADASITLTDRFGWSLHAQTGADGAFRVADAPTGTTYDLHYRIGVSAAGFEPLDTGLAHAVTRGAYDAGDLVLTPLPPPPDLTPPFVVSYGPTGANEPLDSEIRVTFSEAMDQASVAAALSVTPAPPAGAVMVWHGTTLTLSAGAPLAASTRYHVLIDSGASDAAGNAMTDPFGWSFTTVRAQTTPMVLDHFPVGGKAPPGKPIAIVFSEPMDHASVERGVSVSPGLYEDTRTWWNGNTFYLRGHRAMDHGTTYTVTVDASIVDAEGDALGAPFAWSFTTAPGAKGGPFNVDRPIVAFPPRPQVDVDRPALPTIDPLVVESPQPPREPNEHEKKADEPRLHEPNAEKTRKDEGQADEPKVNEPKAEKPRKADLKADEPKAEKPKEHEPKAEPKKEDPKKAEPKKESPTADDGPSSRAESPKADRAEDAEPATDAERPRVLSVRAPQLDMTKLHAPKIEFPKAPTLGSNQGEDKSREKDAAAKSAQGRSPKER